jgi:hypothetical protein
MAVGSNPIPRIELCRLSLNSWLLAKTSTANQGWADRSILGKISKGIRELKTKKQVF